MKRITLLIMLLCLTGLGFAQEEVAIEQTINQPIRLLRIDKGWNVRLMHRNTNDYRLAVVVPEQYARIASEVQACNLTGDTLTILQNNMLPQGSVLELEGPLNFQIIALYNEAKAVIDHLVIPEIHTNYEIYLGKKSETTIHHLVSNGEPYINMSNESQLTIDTIQGSGKPTIEMYNAKFLYGTNLLDGEILVTGDSCMMKGYYRHPEDTAAVLRDGVLYTGDLGKWDENGRLHIIGRKKEILVLQDGTKIFLPEYESRIAAVLPGRDFAVIAPNGKPVLLLVDPDISLQVKESPADNRARAEIQDRLRKIMAGLPRGQQLSSVLFTDRPLPRTATGKVKRWELQS